MGRSARWAVLVILIGLAGCAPGEGALAPSEVRATLAAQLAETRQAQTAALSLWDRVIFGEVVSCQEAIPVPAALDLPRSVGVDDPQAALIQDRLNAAVRSIRDSSDLWNIECADARPAVPLDVARQGRASALDASAPLDEAAQALAGWP